MKQPSNFPKGFLWGASTSTHQVEGGNYNQWSVWELQHAAELARDAAHKYPMASRAHTISQLPIWQELRTQIQDPENYVSGKGVDHYRRYKEDFDIIEKLNMNAFRFGVEWSRIEPEEGVWNKAAIDHYKEYIADLRDRGIEPFLTLFHFSLPVWFAEKGGFEKSANLRYWNRFVEKVTEELLTDVNYVITLNEPNVYASFGYVLGEHPPAKKDPLLFSIVYWNLVKAHRSAYKIIKQRYPDIQIGLASQLANIQAKRPHNVMDGLATQYMRNFWNWWFLRRVRNQQDFVGFNYYFTDYYRVDGNGFVRPADPEVPFNDLGWYMEPEGLYYLLLRVWSRFKKPIIITESGVADKDDSYRQWWIEESVIAMERAISEGVDLRGYFHWSLLDNFEWSFGWWPNFGLVAVDRKNNMKRTIRPSALWFAKRIKQLQENK